MTTQFQSSIGQAIALLQSGQRMTQALAAQLREDGYDVPSLVARYSR